MKTKTIKKDTVNIITLGCSKNLVDSEVMMAQLHANGIEAKHESTDNENNIIIVNTCGFIDNAKEESINTVLSYAQAKSNGKIDKLYVTGCLSERYKEQLIKEIPEVDAFFGTLELPALLAKFNADYKHELVGERTTSTPPHYAYMKIAEGCNRTCSFCAIPIMRGKHRSRPVEELVHEAKNLAAQGVKEILLIAQELTFYGLDIYKKRSLSTLLHALSEIKEIQWIRLHYAYPSQFPLDIIDCIAKYDNICNYIDMPLQHASDRILKSMRRNITQKQTRQLIQTIREKVNKIAIRTTMLVGFPGETEEDFEELIRFVKEMKFERLGVFTYSHEEGTKAYGLIDDVPTEIKQERARRLMEVQGNISLSINQSYIGKTVNVLFDRKENDYFIGRTQYDSPDVDNEVLVSARNQYVRIGDFAPIYIHDATEFDLYGTTVSAQANF